MSSEAVSHRATTQGLNPVPILIQPRDVPADLFPGNTHFPEQRRLQGMCMFFLLRSEIVWSVLLSNQRVKDSVCQIPPKQNKNHVFEFSLEKH